MPSLEFLDFLPGKFSIRRGCTRDYQHLAMFHYVAKRPATWADVWVVQFVRRSSFDDAPAAQPRIVAIGVLSYPVPSCGPRERFIGLSPSRNDNLRFANANIRTISRIIVHPVFRSLGLASMLVRCLCDNCQTRYIEAIATMGRVHPLFERAGMTCVEPGYYILDRAASPAHCLPLGASSRDNNNTDRLPGIPRRDYQDLHR